MKMKLTMLVAARKRGTENMRRYFRDDKVVMLAAVTRAA